MALKRQGEATLPVSAAGRPPGHSQPQDRQCGSVPGRPALRLPTPPLGALNGNRAEVQIFINCPQATDLGALGAGVPEPPGRRRLGASSRGVGALWTYFVLRFPPLLRPPLLLLPFLLPLPFQPPVRLFLVRVAVVLLPLFLPTPLLSSRGILDLLSSIVFQFTFFQLTIFPANQPPNHCELRGCSGAH